MKIGLRIPDINKSLKARTTGRVNRKIKSLTNPFYGKKGIGFIKDPDRAIYNKIYAKTTIGFKDIKSFGHDSKNADLYENDESLNDTYVFCFGPNKSKYILSLLFFAVSIVLLIFTLHSANSGLIMKPFLYVFLYIIFFLNGVINFNYREINWFNKVIKKILLLSPEIIAIALFLSIFGIISLNYILPLFVFMLLQSIFLIIFLK